jgi:hypothetical protein
VSLVNADYQIVSLASLSKCPFFIIDAAVWFLGFLLMIKGQVQVLFNLYREIKLTKMSSSGEGSTSSRHCGHHSCIIWPSAIHHFCSSDI